jgi:hypothetical protein
MTQRESEQLAKLTDAMGDVRADIAVLVQKIENLIELRNVNGVLTRTQFQSFSERCDERHGAVIERMVHLERSERKQYGALNKLKGATAPSAVFVAIVALIVNFIR